MTIWMTSIHKNSSLLTTVTYLHKNFMHPVDKSTSVCIQLMSSNTSNSFNIWQTFKYCVSPTTDFLPPSPIHLLQSDNKTPYEKYPVAGQCDSWVSPVSKPWVAGLKNRHFVAGYFNFKKEIKSIGASALKYTVLVISFLYKPNRSVLLLN